MRGGFVRRRGRVLRGSVGVEVNARVKTASVLVAVAMFLALAMRAPDNQPGWPEWVCLSAIVLAAVAAWMLVVETRDPWDEGRR